MSLKEAQWQIGDVVFGRNSSIEVVSVEPIGYEVSAGDFQMPMSDNLRFRKDYIQPGVLQFQLAAMDNFVLPGMLDAPYTGPELKSAHDLIENFKREWRADDTRTQWGWVKPLTYRAIGQGRMVFGRPRNVASGRLRQRPGWYGITASYQMADTFSYDSEVSEELISATSSAPGGSIARGDGQAPTWLRMVATGPLANPVIKVGPFTFNIAWNIPAGVALEINSAPWERRAISSTSLNLRTKLVGSSPYLKDVFFPSGEEWDIGLHGTGATSATKLLVQWREAHHSV